MLGAHSPVRHGGGPLLTSDRTLMAEQSADARPTIKVLKDGRRVLVDPELTVSRSYLYLYLMMNVAAMCGETGPYTHTHSLSPSLPTSSNAAQQWSTPRSTSASGWRT